MMWISVPLQEDEKNALRALAEIEYRTPRSQAAILIRESLERRGLLPDIHPTEIQQMSYQPNQEARDAD